MTIRLARAPVPILVWLGMRVFIGEVAVIVGLNPPGSIGPAVLVVGALVLLYGATLAIHVLTLRLIVLPGRVVVRSALFRRRYELVSPGAQRHPTPVGHGAFGTVLGTLGIELGRGHTESGRALEVIRLAATDSIVLIPCRNATLAVVPSSERALLSAIARAVPAWN